VRAARGSTSAAAFNCETPRRYQALAAAASQLIVNNAAKLVMLSNCFRMQQKVAPDLEKRKRQSSRAYLGDAS
jgi:hypothetical protein